MPEGGGTELWIRRALLACAGVCVATSVGIVLVLAFQTAGFLAEVSWAELLGDTRWAPFHREPRFGLWPLIAGTALTAGLAIAFATPVGILAAIYLSEFSRPAARRILKPALELLVGVPTIVYGYFALILVTPALQQIVPDLAPFNALAPGFALGVMIVPIIASLGDDALQTVPPSLREASFALGASHVRTVFGVLLPSAKPMLIASVMLALSRALGETMIVAIAAGSQPRLTLDPRVPVETMTAFVLQVGVADAPAGTLEYRSVFMVATCLFAVTFVANLGAQKLIQRKPRVR